METPLILGVLAMVAISVVLWPFRQRRPAAVAAPPDDSAGDLRRELEARYRALAELDDDLASGKLSAADHARLRAELERAAASLLRRVEASETPTPSHLRRAPARRETTGASFAPWRRSTLGLIAGGTAGACLLVGVGLGYLLFRESAAPAPRAPIRERGADGRPDARPAPTDVKGLLAFGHQALDQQRLPDAVWAYRQVLSLEPDNVEAITHTGILIFQSGQVDQALAHLDRALAIEPRYLHALWDRAQILYHAKQDYAGAITALEAFLAVAAPGPDADRAHAMLAEAKARRRPATSTGAAATRRPP